MRRRSSSTGAWLPLLTWLVALALLPWWLGLPMLLALAALLVLLRHRLLPRHQWLLRRSLSWGLPGVLFALQRGLHGGVPGWVAALLGLLAGYTLLAGLDGWINPRHPRAPISAHVDEEWAVMAVGSSAPPVEIIELKWPLWSVLSDDDSSDPHWHDGDCHFADGACIEGVGHAVSFSPDRQCLVAELGVPARGVVVWQRQRRQLHRLPGWQLSGWYRNQPWLVRRESDMPLALAAVLGHDDV